MGTHLACAVVHVGAVAERYVEMPGLACRDGDGGGWRGGAGEDEGYEGDEEVEVEFHFGGGGRLGCVGWVR